MNLSEAIISFAASINYLSERFLSNNFVFCFDSKYNLRREVYPYYKSKEGRNKKEEDKRIVGYTLDYLKNEFLLEEGYVNIFEKKGYEADDIIASIVLNLPKKDESVIVSTDKDLWQLIEENVSIWNYKSLMTLERFSAKYEIHPTNWKKVKSISGCASDNIQGVHGVGENTAIKFLLMKLANGKIYRRILDEWDSTVKRNLKLIELPYPGTGRFNLQAKRSGNESL